jgi:hypothetical protein
MEPVTASDSKSDSVGQDGVGEWLDLRSAAARLHVSERTLYRRMVAGKLRRRETMNGRPEVWLPDGASPTLSDEKSDTVRPPEQERQITLLERFGETVRSLVEPLQRDLSEARGQVERLARENGELASDIRHLRARLAELEVRLSASDTKSDSVNRPWWAFWRG